MHEMEIKCLTKETRKVRFKTITETCIECFHSCFRHLQILREA